MPRIAVCTNYADRDKPHFSGENEHYDFCRVCYPRADAEELAERHGVPEEAVDFDVEHPSYDEWDYECCECNDTLTVGDNH
jgi:hypothetical protein